MNLKRLGSFAGVLIGVGGITFVAIRLARDWNDFADALSSAEPGWLIAALIAGFAAPAMIGFNWFVLLRERSVAVTTRHGFRWFFVGQLGKYVPGGIWPIVGQGELAHRSGVARSDAYSTTAVSMMGTFVGAVGLAVVTGFASPSGRWPIAALLGSGLVVGFGCIASTAFRSRLHGVVDGVTKRDLRLPEARRLAVVSLRHLPVWLAFSAVNVAVVAALGGSLDVSIGAGLVIDLAFVTCLSWMAGFVVVGLPGGIGVREALFVSMMTSSLGAALAVSVAVIGRLVSIVVDVAAAAVSVPVATIGARCPDPSS